MHKNSRVQNHFTLVIDRWDPLKGDSGEGPIQSYIIKTCQRELCLLKTFQSGIRCTKQGARMLEALNFVFRLENHFYSSCVCNSLLLSYQIFNGFKGKHHTEFNWNPSVFTSSSTSLNSANFPECWWTGGHYIVLDRKSVLKEMNETDLW